MARFHEFEHVHSEVPQAHRATQAVHAGEAHPQAEDALTTPIFQTATYSFTDTAALRDYLAGQVVRDKYGRYGNPTQHAVERKLACLEGGEETVLFSSGMAAVTTGLLAYLSAGDQVVFSGECYKQIRQFARTVLPRAGVAVSFFDASDPSSLKKTLRDNTALVFVESPSNPFLTVVDLDQVACLTRARGIPLMVDSTFATPINQRPLAWGANLVVHSATKYLGGHNDLLAGAIIGSHQTVEPVRRLQAMLGNIIDPHNAYLLLRGLKTLALRIKWQNQSALEIARFLEGHPQVERVYYPGLVGHPSYEVARRQLDGYGGVISFELRGDNEATACFIDALKLPAIASSFGGVDSLVEQTWLMSYARLTPEERDRLGIRDNLVRLSVGIEDPQDLIADLDQALEKLAQHT